MFKYLTHIPVPSEDVIAAAYNSLNLEIIKSFERYHLYKCDNVLLKFLTSYFPENTKFGVQKILDGQKIHIDHRRSTAYNFILDTGGNNVTTCFWSDLNGTILLEEIKIEKFKWHSLNVTIPHSVKNIESERIAITAWTSL